MYVALLEPVPVQYRMWGMYGLDNFEASSPAQYSIVPVSMAATLVVSVELRPLFFFR